jgi:hypothetical protein
LHQRRSAIVTELAMLDARIQSVNRVLRRGVHAERMAKIKVEDGLKKEAVDEKVADVKKEAVDEKAVKEEIPEADGAEVKGEIPEADGAEVKGESSDDDEDALSTDEEHREFDTPDDFRSYSNARALPAGVCTACYRSVHGKTEGSHNRAKGKCMKWNIAAVRGRKRKTECLVEE